MSAASMRPRSRLPAAFGAALAFWIALFSLAARLASIDGVPLASLLRDTTATLNAPFHTGLLSNIGILMWGSCTTVCLFAAVVVDRASTGVIGARFFLAAAAVTAWLALDDALLLHEQVFPIYLGLPGQLSLAIGGGATLALLIAFRRAVLASDLPVLVAALALLGGSAGLDLLDDRGMLGALLLHSSALQTLLEDGMKLLGITLWLCYFTLTARHAIVGRPADPR